jgi:inositol transport system substrate-binding protein
MKKKISILLTIIMTFVIFSGCGLKNKSASNKKVKILLSISDASDNFRKLIVINAKSYAKSEKVELTVRNAAGSIEKQVSNMKEAVADGYNAIICAPVDPNTALELERAAQGIPIVFMNNSPNDSLLEKNKYIYVASDEKVAGQYQADYIINYFKNKKNIKVVLIKGSKEYTATNERTEAVKQTFERKGINAKYVFEDNANWSRETAKEMFNVFLSTGRKFNCVISNNDEMALGVIDSLIEHKIDPASIPIVGIDATSEGCKAIEDGSMKFTVYQSAKGQSESAVKAAIELGSGNDLSNIKNLSSDGKHIWIPFEKVDKNNVAKYMN